VHPANAPPIAPHCRSRNHQKPSREFSRLFLQSYHVQDIPNTLKPSATSQSRRQNPAFFFPPRPKVKRSHKFPNSQTSLLWANESGSYPSYPSLRVQDLRAATSRPANARRRLLHRFLGRATQAANETPSATVRASTIKILNLPLPDPIGQPTINEAVPAKKRSTVPSHVLELS